jgi:hypothetical protein
LDITKAVTPLMLNAVAVLRLVPVMVTSVPTGPEVGLKEVIAGATILALAYTCNPARIKNKKKFFIITGLEENIDFSKFNFLK